MLRVLVFVCFALSVQAEELTSAFRLIGLSSEERIADLHQTLEAVDGIKLVALDAAKAEVTLRYDMETLFPKYPPKKPRPAADEIEKRLNDVIGPACSRTFVLKPLSKLPEDKLQKLTIKAGVLDCKACRYAVYIAVANMDGVERASVDVKTSVLTAWVDGAKVKREDLESALKKARIEVLQ